MTATLMTGGTVADSLRDQQARQIAASARRIEILIPAMLDAASFRVHVGGTSKRPQGVPGGVAFYSFRREVATTLFGYGKDVRDAADLTSEIYSNAHRHNARLISAHAEHITDESPRPCSVHGVNHASIAHHLGCLQVRLERYCRPPAPSEFGGPCPALLPDGSSCNEDFRATETEGGSCDRGHVLDAELVRYVNLQHAKVKPLTLTQASKLSRHLAPREITVDALRMAVKRKQRGQVNGLPSVMLPVAGVSVHHVRWEDVTRVWSRLFIQE